MKGAGESVATARVSGNVEERLMQQRTSVVVRLLALMLGSVVMGQALAHHSFAVFFDNEKGIAKVEGVVTEFRFKNPHGIIRVNVKGKDGATEEWRAETNSPSILERRGWTRDSLKVGDAIVLEGWQARDGSNYMRMRKVTRTDGTP